MNMRPNQSSQLIIPTPLTKNMMAQAFKMKENEKILVKGYIGYDNKAQSILKKFHRELITLKNN